MNVAACCVVVLLGVWVREREVGLPTAIDLPDRAPSPRVPRVPRVVVLLKNEGWSRGSPVARRLLR